MITLPDRIEDEQQLNELLTTPSNELIEFAASLRGPIVILGAGGKMGPTLAARLQAAIDQAGSDAQAIAVSRFSDPASRTWLQDRGVETIAADLMQPEAYTGLPDAEQVIYLIGSKFGTRQNPSHTWAINTIAPANAMRRYRTANLVALSTGNVYAFTPADSGGSLENDDLQPVGEYACAAVGRERIFEHFCQQNQTPVALIRLNYATDLRYGVLTDLATQVASGSPVDVTQGFFNCIWQGDANDLIIRALKLAACPAKPLNLTSLETLSVREVARQMADQLGCDVRFTGQEAETALLSNAAQCSRLLGPPQVPTDTVIRWVTDWVSRGGRLLGKPTHFEVRDGGF